ncbi:MAG: hypothetical protein KH415_21875 [Clostridium sp.]|nr:hypothetical protein [Clostridium sp.]
MSKFKVGDKVIKSNGKRWTTGEKYKKIELVDSLVGYKLNRCLGYWKEKELKLYKEDKMEKTFKEVKNKIETYYIYIKESELFKLQRKEYTFQEAFKAYKEGRIPESTINGQILDSHSRIDMRIIEGKWYIND